MDLTKEQTKFILEELGYSVDRHYKFKMRDEQTASASIDERGRISDFGSGWRGDIVEFYKLINNCNYKTAILNVKRILNNVNSSVRRNSRENSSKNSRILEFQKSTDLSALAPIEQSVIDKFIKNRKENFTFYKELLGLALPSLDFGAQKDLALRYEIGLDGAYLAMPVRGENNEIVNIWRYNPLGKGAKYIFEKCRSRAVFNIPSLREYISDKESEIFIAEGEKDCLNMLGHGMRAISLGSATALPSARVLELLSGANVVIAYDYDEAGLSGAKRAQNELLKVCKSVRILDFTTLIDTQKLFKGFDFTDYLCYNAKTKKG